MTFGIYLTTVYFSRCFLSFLGLFQAQPVSSLCQPGNFFLNLINHPIQDKKIHAVRSMLSNEFQFQVKRLESITPRKRSKNSLSAFVKRNTVNKYCLHSFIRRAPYSPVVSCPAKMLERRVGINCRDNSAVSKLMP